MHLVVEFPKLDHSVVSCQHAKTRCFVVYKLDGVYFLVKLNRLQMVKLRLMTLNLSEVSVVKIPGVFEVDILENDNTASVVTDCKIVSSFVIRNRRENVAIGYTAFVSLS